MPKVQTCLLSGSGSQKALLIQVLGQDIGHYRWMHAAQPSARFCYRAESDITLAKMTYMPTCQSAVREEGLQDQATEKWRELVARIRVSG